MNRVKFVSNRDGGWRNNDYVPNSYAVMRGNDELGILIKMDAKDDWGLYRKMSAPVDGGKYELNAICRAKTFSKLKEKAIEFIGV